MAPERDGLFADRVVHESCEPLPIRDRGSDRVQKCFHRRRHGWVRLNYGLFLWDQAKKLDKVAGDLKAGAELRHVGRHRAPGREVGAHRLQGVRVRKHFDNEIIFTLFGIKNRSFLVTKIKKCGSF